MLFSDGSEQGRTRAGVHTGHGRTVLAAIVVSLCMVAVPGVAVASAPTASTSGAVSTGASTATVTGAVNPGGETTTYEVQYDLQGKPWCAFFRSGTATYTTSPQTLPYTDNSSHNCRSA